MSEIFLLLPAFYIAVVFRATTFGNSPGRMAANTGVRSIVPKHSNTGKACLT